MGTAQLEFSPLYGFVRSRQLEGTFPCDAQTGVRGLTTFRVKRGWGNILESDWPYAQNTVTWPPIEPPGLDAKAKQYRILRYQRITTKDECKYALLFHGGVAASFHIIRKQWYEADDGVIEMPPAGDQPDAAHAISIIGYDDRSGRFTFANSWGTRWGDKGFGYMPYEFFSKWLIEAFIVDGVGDPLPGQSSGKGIAEITWTQPDFLGRTFYAHEVYDSDADERIGWAFAVEKTEHWAVEDVYVRPQFQRQGYGERLRQSLSELSAQTLKALQSGSDSWTGSTVGAMCSRRDATGLPLWFA